MIDGAPVAWRPTCAAPVAVGKIISGAPAEVIVPVATASPADVTKGKVGEPVAWRVIPAAPNDVGRIMLGAPLDVLVIWATPAATGRIILGEPVA